MSDQPPEPSVPSRNDAGAPSDTKANTEQGEVSGEDTARASEQSMLKSDSSWRSRSSVVVLVVVMILGFGADIGSKWLAFRYVAGEPQTVVRDEVLTSGNLSHLLTPHEPKTVVPGLLEFSLVLNPGAVFGMGAGKRVVFIAFTLAALGFGLWMFGAWTKRGDRSAHVAIALLMAGGLGNLYDRIRFACVRDFIHPLPGTKLPFGLRNPLDGSQEIWPYVSNIADLLLLIGIGMLMVFLWRGGRTHDEMTASHAKAHSSGKGEKSKSD